MIDANNSSVSNFVDVKKFVGAARVHVLAVNPSNTILKNYGWEIADGAPEPQYVYKDDMGKSYARVRFLVQILNLKEKPVVPLDFWVRNEKIIGENTGKCRVIDSYGRVAWASKEDVMAKPRRIPQYSNGPANIAADYQPCHPGQEKLIAFLFKYLNVMPLKKYNNTTKQFENTKNPGHISFDNWAALCEGNVSEIEAGLRQAPNNEVFVVLGVKITEENKTYQTFLNFCDGTTSVPYFGPNSKIDEATGTYTSAQKMIDKYNAAFPDSNVSFTAMPVHEWTEVASEVTDNTNKMFDSEGNFALEDESDLPFAL